MVLYESLCVNIPFRNPPFSSSRIEFREKQKSNNNDIDVFRHRGSVLESEVSRSILNKTKLQCAARICERLSMYEFG